MRAGIVTATPENKRSPRSPTLRSELESDVRLGCRWAFRSARGAYQRH